MIDGLEELVFAEGGARGSCGQYRLSFSPRRNLEVKPRIYAYYMTMLVNLY